MATNDIVPRLQRCFHWMAHVRLSRIVISLLIFLIIVPLITHYYLSNLGKDNDGDAYHSRSKLDHPEDVDDLEVSKLKQQIEDLKKTKASVNNELRDLDSKRQKVQSDISGYSLQVDLLKSRFDSLNKEVVQTQMSLEQLKLQKDDMMKNYIPEIKAPRRIIANINSSDTLPPPHSSQSCQMYTCFDYSQCSLFSGFPVYFYNVDGLALNSFTKQSFLSVISSNAYITKYPSQACIYIVLIGEQIYSSSSSKNIQTYLQNLAYWKGDGRNHILINLARTAKNLDLFVGVKTGRAMIAQSSFIESQFRRDFDIVLPPNLGIINGETWQNLPLLSPIFRKYLLSFQGKFQGVFTMTGSDKNTEEGAFLDDIDSQETDLQADLQNFRKTGLGQRKLTSLSVSHDSLISREAAIVSALKLMTSSQDSFSLQFICESGDSFGTNGEWALCNNEQERSDILRQSTFSLIIAPVNYSVQSSSVFQIRLYESIKYGAVPVILGDSVRLPFEEIIDWHNAVIRISKPRITELHFLIKSYTEVDIAELRRNCRLIWESFFSTTAGIFDSILATMRTRLKIPALPVKDVPGKSLFSASFPRLKLEGPDPEPETDEVLGPIEQRFPSPTYQHNFSVPMAADSFRRAADPFHLYPFTPFDKQLPSESKFFGSSYGYRPIGKGSGGAGKEFSAALGGNQRREQFTIVLLTYEREAVLISALQRLKGLPFLNKVIVVWNSPKMPSDDLRWPEIGIPILVVKASKNSLNNRFLPFDEIETEAILSIDDDAHLRHDEIVFGFRVWREERDRIVGFPGRFHAFDLNSNAWLYNSNYSCELSMVLTGAAFYHKYYAYLYSNWMPQSIRDKVDEYLNCEDIAMNFLVSHITRKPPLKVTSRWTFRCPGCPALSNETSHFEERHKCINFFVKVYGYMPLLYTQYRADSVLFKTRLPHTKQKCFRFI